MPYGTSAPFYTYPNASYTPYQAPTYGSYQPQQQMPSMAQNQPLNGFQAQSQVNAQPQAQQAVIPTKTNVPLVTSLTEAMGRTTELNSDTFYADQDKPFIYRVSVDMQGRKTYKTFELTDVTEQEVAQSSTSNVDYATKADLKALEEKLMGYAMTIGIGSTTTPKSKRTDKAIVKAEKEEVVEYTDKE